MRIVQKECQLKFIWEDVASPIIPQESQRKMTDLCGELFLAYWENCHGNNNNQQQGDKYE